VPELSGIEDIRDIRTNKGARPPGYPAPIADHGAERVEALRRYRDI
jgi:deoxyribodipyrimidine photo-lyase